jgi:uncharacterized protein YtpQ (UPF0354 family)
MRLARPAALACAALLPLLAFAAEPLGPAAFTRRFAAELRRAFPGAEVGIAKDLEVRVVEKGGHEQTAFLANAYGEYRQAPEELDALLERFVGSMRSAAARPSKERVARDRIVPTIKHRAWLEEVRKVAGPKAKPLATEQLAPELFVVYAEDTPENVRYLPAEDLGKAGIRPPELRRLAVRNLLALLPDVHVEGGKEGVYMVIADGNYEATLVLADAVVAKLPKVKGEPVFAIPARDLLLFAGSEDAAAVALLRQFAAKLSEESSYSLSPALFVRRGGKLVAF